MNLHPNSPRLSTFQIALLWAGLQKELTQGKFNWDSDQDEIQGLEMFLKEAFYNAEKAEGKSPYYIENDIMDDGAARIFNQDNGRYTPSHLLNQPPTNEQLQHMAFESFKGVIINNIVNNIQEIDKKTQQTVKDLCLEYELPIQIYELLGSFKTMCSEQTLLHEVEETNTFEELFSVMGAYFGYHTEEVYRVFFKEVY